MDVLDDPEATPDADLPGIPVPRVGSGPPKPRITAKFGEIDLDVDLPVPPEADVGEADLLDEPDEGDLPAVGAPKPRAPAHSSDMQEAFGSVDLPEVQDEASLPMPLAGTDLPSARAGRPHRRREGRYEWSLGSCGISQARKLCWLRVCR